MASEIIVQTIKGPTSGANANKIIVPSGQTLDIAGDWTPPVGSVVNCETYLASSSSLSINTTTQANGFVLPPVINYTKKFSDSLIVVKFCFPIRDYTDYWRESIRFDHRGLNQFTSQTYSGWGDIAQDTASDTTTESQKEHGFVTHYVYGGSNATQFINREVTGHFKYDAPTVTIGMVIGSSGGLTVRNDRYGSPRAYLWEIKQ